MTGRGDGGTIALWAGAAALVALSAGVMFWIWQGGGVRVGTPVEPTAQVEECGAVLAGSTAMGARLAPEIAAAFLRESGYEVAPISDAEDGAKIVVGARGEFRCTITVRANTSTQGLRDLAAGDALVALAQRPITRADIDMLAEAGAGDFAAERALAEHVVGFDAYGVAVHADNPLREIGIDDVREVALAGKTNWSEFGWEEAPITLYAAFDGVGPQDYPNDLVQHPSPDWVQARLRARIQANETAVVAALADDPTGFAFVSSAFLRNVAGVRPLPISAGGPAFAPTATNIRSELYPLARRLFVYVRPADMRENTFVQRFVAYFKSPPAFNLIDNLGFVALRPESRLSQAAANLSGCRFGTAEYAALMSATRGAERLAVELRFVPATMRLDDETQRNIVHYASALRGRLAGGATVILIGHADFTGEVQKNRALGLRRALVARGAFEAQGVFGIEVESAGEQCPLADNQTDEGRELNRRVDIWVRPAPGEAVAVSAPAEAGQ